MGELPRASSNQRGPAKYKDPLLASKLDKVLERQYIRKGPVKAFIDYFDVPKVPDDIRIVYHGSKYGLNAQLWTPRFYMPNGSATTNVMSFETYLKDSDVGEMFPNFPMDLKLRPHVGVDLLSLSHCLKNYETPISNEESERWERLLMDMAPSPYIAIRMYYVAENVRPTLGPIGTPCGNWVWGIRCLIQKYYGQTVIWHRPGELLIPNCVGPTQPTSPDGPRRRIRLHIIGFRQQQNNRYPPWGLVRG
jgi:hypothetical protein